MRRRSVWLLSICALASVNCATAGRLDAFTLALGREHPLTGRIYDVHARAFLGPAELEQRVAAAHFAVLGETHDNADHHRLQARLVQRFVAAHGGGAVAFEMLDETVDPIPARAFDDAGALAQAVAWADSGWPDFAIYRPIFEAALAAKAKLLAASPSGQHVRESMAGVDAAQAAALNLDQPLPAAAQQALEREIVQSHCGHASPAMIQGMSRAQTYKDAYMAQRMRQAARPVVLIAGRGHAGSDRGVPRFLRLSGSEPVLSLALVEVVDNMTEPDAYQLDAFDLVVFTPRASDEDACQKFREQLQRMRAQ